MANEIERKFLIKELPDLSNLESIRYERYFLFKNSNVEMRIQKKGEKYEFERKEKENNLSAKKVKFDITKEEFERLKIEASESIVRESFLVSKNPEISIKIYHDKFEGLERVEVEFENEIDAKDFQPLEWFGNEITNSSLGRDSKLMDLNENDFKNILAELSEQK